MYDFLMLSMWIFAGLGIYNYIGIVFSRVKFNIDETSDDAMIMGWYQRYAWPILVLTAFVILIIVTLKIVIHWTVCSIQNPQDICPVSSSTLGSYIKYNYSELFQEMIIQDNETDHGN